MNGTGELSREGLLTHLWESVIDPHLSPGAIERTAAGFERDSAGPFGDTGAALRRLLDAGAAPRDLAVVCRFAAYEAVFGTLYALNDPGAGDSGVLMLHEDLLGADPRGRDGRVEAT